MIAAYCPRLLFLFCSTAEESLSLINASASPLRCAQSHPLQKVPPNPQARMWQLAMEQFHYLTRLVRLMLLPPIQVCLRSCEARQPSILVPRLFAYPQYRALKTSLSRFSVKILDFLFSAYSSVISRLSEQSVFAFGQTAQQRELFHLSHLQAVQARPQRDSFLWSILLLSETRFDLGLLYYLNAQACDNVATFCNRLQIYVRLKLYHYPINAVAARPTVAPYQSRQCRAGFFRGTENGDPAAAFPLFLEGRRDERGVVAAKTERVI